MSEMPEGESPNAPSEAQRGSAPGSKRKPGVVSFGRMPRFSRRSGRLIIFGFAALAFIGLAAVFEHHPARAPEAQKHGLQKYGSEIPENLAVTPADFAGWPQARQQAAAEGVRQPAEVTLAGQGGVEPPEMVGNRIPADQYNVIRETGGKGQVGYPKANEPSGYPYGSQSGRNQNGYQRQTFESEGGVVGTVQPESAPSAYQRDPARSPLFFNAGMTFPGSALAHHVASLAGAAPTPPTLVENKYVQQNMAKEKQEFLASQKGDYGAYLNNRYITPIAPANELLAGTLIPMTMVTGIDSDLPGTIIAQVNENVYDTITGTNILVPAGTRLIGSYDNSISFGQNRVLLAWSRLIEPDGVSIELRGMPGTGLGGRAGLQDKVDYHLKQILGGLSLETIFNIGTDAAISALSTASFLQSIASASIFSGSAASSSGSAAQQIVEQYATKLLNQQPTIKVRPGYRGYVIVNKDMILPAYPSTTIPYGGVGD